MKCILDEWKKIGAIKYFGILIVALLLGNIVIGFLYHNSEGDSVENLQKEKQSYIEMMQIADVSNDEEDIVNKCEEQIALIDYSIEKGVPYQQLGIVSNFVKNGMLENIVVIMVIIMSYNLIMVESENKTWKNLLILNKLNSKKILLRKKAAVGIGILGAIVLFTGIALLFGMIRYGNWGNIQVLYDNGTVTTTNYNSEVINVCISIVMKCLVYAGFAGLMAILFHKTKMGIIVPIILLLMEGNIYSFLSYFKWDVILPFKHMNVLEHITYFRAKEIVIAFIYLVVCFIVMEITSFFSLRKITN
jgi:hypothetical protein